MRKILAMAMVMLLFVSTLLAQERTITGKVTDEKGTPVPNASILVKGSTVGTTTREDGSYTLRVPGTARVIVISSIDLEPKEVTIGSLSNISVTLVAKAQGMDEVIVVAYGTVKKSENTGSSAQITAKDIEKRPVTNVLNAIVGSAPGIQTTTASGQPGSSPAIRLRGFSSPNGNNNPLIVVDGVVYNGGLANINPDDVASVSTLKDGASAALFGSRAANGVIMITTKRGKKGRNSLTFKAAQGFTSRGIPEYDRANPGEFYQLMWESYRNSLAYRASNPIPLADASKIATGLFPRNAAGNQIYAGGTYTDVYTEMGKYNPFRGVGNTDIVREDGTLNPNANNGNLLYGDDLDWFDAFYKNGSRSEYGMTYSGGTDKSDYFGSFNYTKEKGFVTRSDLERFTGRVSVNTNPTTWFRTGINISGSTIKANQPADGGIVNPFSFARSMGPIYPVFAHNPTTGEYLLDANGNKIYDIGNIAGVGARPVNQGRHAIYENILNKSGYRRNILSGRAFGEITILRDLKATVNATTDIQDYLENSYENPIVGDGAPSGRASRTIEKNSALTLNQLINYSKKFGQHNISAMVGHEYYKFTYNYFYGFKVGQVFNDGNTEMGNFTTISSLASQEDNHRMESYLSKLNYDFDGKYFLSGSFRRDGNSRFAPEYRWDNFWSVGGAWLISREAFMKVPFIDELKLRASYAKTGNDGGFGYYPYMGLYGLGYNNGAEAGVVQTALANEKLQWEGQNAIDVGVEFALFRGRLTGTVEYFHRTSTNLIFSVPQPLSNGGTTSGTMTIRQNVGELYNKGFEASISGDIIRNKNFNWNVTINATTLKNKMTKMPPVTPRIQNGTKQLEAEKSVYEYYLRRYKGVDAQTGLALYTAQTYNAANSFILDNDKGGKDTVTNLISNARYEYVGKSSIPDVYGSLINSFRYKNFELGFVLTYQVGGWAYDNGYASLMHAGTYGTALHKDAVNRWVKSGDVTNVPRMEQNNTANLNAGTSDRWLISATHLSINSANLSYNVPVKWLNSIGGQNAKIFVSGENLYLFAKRKGLMVNQNFDGTNSNAYPPARVVTLGANITF